MTSALTTAAVLLSVVIGQADTPPSLTDQYRDTANRIIAAAAKDNNGWLRMQQLCDDIGHRLSGSKGLEKAIAWAIASLKADGHENVRGEKVMVPRWTRGLEHAEMLEPRKQEMSVLALGGSVGTGRGGIRAEVVVVTDEAELQALGESVKGKIVLFDNPMPGYDAQRGGSHYGRTVRFRVRGADMASKLGAVAVLVRSVTAYSLHTPHTGMLAYSGEVKKIPAAAITVEDGTLIHRLIDRGKRVRLELELGAENHGEVESANVIAEIVGREKPEEIVVISGHLDSWDVGTGAHDDGAGVVMAMEALSVLRRLGLRPRRTIRVVLWTNEENGLKGAKAYVADHADELPKHAAALEADSGCFEPKGFSLDLRDPDKSKRGIQQLRKILALLSPIGATYAKAGFAGADVGAMAKSGVPLLGLRMDISTYFNYHHTRADTLDKIDPAHLTANITAFAVLAYVLADMPDRLGDEKPPPGT